MVVRIVFHHRILLSLCLASGIILGGCAEGPTKVDPALIKSLRKDWVLTTEPNGAITPLDWRDEHETTTNDEDDTNQETNRSVVFVGKVGGIPNPWPEQYSQFPWVLNESTFFMVDPSTVAEFESHAGGTAEEAEAHAADCPFCAREAANQTKSIAAISFVDDQGKPKKIDARELFDLDKGDVVVVTGEANLLGDLLVLEANGIFRRE